MADSINAGDGAAAQELQSLISAAQRAAGRGLPPVHLWDPPFCGDIGMKIARDGTWFYCGSPIGRPAMVRLFSTILRKDLERYVLVTPVEKVAIDVEDAPFLAVEMRIAPGDNGDSLTFRTNVDDLVTADAEHPLRFEPGEADGLKPYVRVRDDLWALLTRALFYDLVERGETRDIEGRAKFGVASAGQFFVMCDADALEELT